MFHPKTARYLKQILVFALIWLIFGFIYVIVEYGILGRNSIYPATGNAYNFKSNLIATTIGSFIMGCIQGWIEVKWLRKRFEKNPLWVKLLAKNSFYIILIIVFLIAMSSINSAFSFNDGSFNEAVLLDAQRFVSSFSFWSVVIYIAFALSIALFFSEISDYIGAGILSNFLLGRYHHPNQENRIFMFLDMKSSTTIAEKLGHEKYFKLISAYYSDMTNAILETSGEIYQYVGDEIVVSWPESKGIFKANCLQCFRKIERTIRNKSEAYVEKFGIVPSFKAGFHIGEVTTGEIGIIKKDIIYTGDTLNTTARIQALCNSHQAKILISKDLFEKLSHKKEFLFTKIGKLTLRGKTEALSLYKVEIE